MQLDMPNKWVFFNHLEYFLSFKCAKLEWNFYGQQKWTITNIQHIIYM